MEQDIIDEFKNSVLNPEDVDAWIEYMAAEYEQQQTKAQQMKAAGAVDELTEFYESNNERMYKEFRSTFRMGILPLSAQAMLEEIWYELNKR